MSLKVVMAALGLVVFNAGLGFVAPGKVTLQASYSSYSAVTPKRISVATTTAATASGTAMYGVAIMATAAAGILLRLRRAPKVATKALHGIKFPYSIQKDSHADLEFQNDIGCLASTRSQDEGIT